MSSDGDIYNLSTIETIRKLSCAATKLTFSFYYFIILSSRTLFFCLHDNQVKEACQISVSSLYPFKIRPSGRSLQFLLLGGLSRGISNLRLSSSQAQLHRQIPSHTKKVQIIDNKTHYQAMIISCSNSLRKYAQLSLLGFCFHQNLLESLLFLSV